MPGFLVHGPSGRLCVGLTCVLSLWNTVSAIIGENRKEQVMTFLPTTGSSLGGEERKESGVAFLDTTELPARLADPSALNLTELVNGMLSRALQDGQKLFSLLSVASHSSFAFHKLSVAVYNVSNLKTADPANFPARYCYCLNNRTNGLADFTALLVDIIGNSTSYLTEISKSTSILSVNRMNDSDCLFICVMTGKSGRNLSHFWELAEKSPVLNYTFPSSLLGAPASRGTAVTSKLMASSQQPPRTLRPGQARSTGAPALTVSPWTEPTGHSARGEQTVDADGPPGTTAMAPATPPAVDSQEVAHVVQRVPWYPSPDVPQREYLTYVNYQESGRKSMGDSKEAGLGFHTAARARGSDGRSDTRAASLGSTSVHGGSIACRGRGGHDHSGPTWQPIPDQPNRRDLHPGDSDSKSDQGPSPQIFTDRSPLLPAGDIPAAWPLIFGEEPALLPGAHRVQVSRCPGRRLHEVATAAGPLTLAIQKLNPCLMELCHFFQQCLCVSQRRDPWREATRFCLEHYPWFLKNAAYVCQRVERVSHSHTLKQRCLENICRSV